MSLLDNVLTITKCAVKVSEVIITGAVQTTKDSYEAVKETVKENPIRLTEENKEDIESIKDSCRRIANSFKKNNYEL